jgi:macrodomain Ter protein organizer (MatP/YcbG family)
VKRRPAFPYHHPKPKHPALSVKAATYERLAAEAKRRGITIGRLIELMVYDAAARHVPKRDVL